MSRLAALLRVAAAVAAVVAALVLPFAYAVSDLPFDLQVAGGTAFTVGTLFGYRAPNGPNPLLGATAAFVVGIFAALIAGLVPGDGLLVLLPPLHGVAIGFLWGTRAEPVATAGATLRSGLGVGLWIGVGLTVALPLTGLMVGVATALAVAVTPEAWRRRALRRRGERPGPWPLVLLALLTLAAGTASAVLAHNDESIAYAELVPLVAGLLLVAPALLFWAMVAGVRWFLPRLQLLRDLGEVVRAFYVPIGAFAIGYLVLVTAAAGLFGTIDRLDPEAFRFAAEVGRPGIGDWLFMAFFVATSQSLVDIVPLSGPAKIAVGLELVLCLAWAVVVFAAVMTRVHPVLQRIADRTSSGPTG
ncbi:MAG: hypothetical protein KDC98_07260 [Planctomycetes bacterium]|nr:hypothetical protein [Planctomycetota bacterium]